MNIFELAIVAGAVFLAVLLGNFLRKWIGPWGYLPAGILALPIAAAFFAPLINRIRSIRHARKS
jgi:hypothetical protein